MSIDLTTVFSPCRLYRYTLWRQWWKDELFINRNKLRYAMFVGLNPSTADETENDPTIRKCIGFAQRWGFDALCMTNLFAFRATDPRKMKACPKPIGDQNDRWLTCCAREAGVIVAAWGVNGEHLGRDEEVMKLLDDVQCLRITKDGHPEHPLYVPYETTLKPYDGIVTTRNISLIESAKIHRPQAVFSNSRHDPSQDTLLHDQPMNVLALRLYQAKERQLEKCAKLLTEAGVPEWVMLEENEGVPANSVSHRLKWFLARRKDVSPSEVDHKFLREMEENMRAAEAYRAQSHEEGKLTGQKGKV